LEILEVYRERVNSYLENYLNSISPDNLYQSELNNIMKYSVLAGGKRFRPILTYTVANLYGIDMQKVDTSACAIELIHIYSLIHDDLPAMDDDDIRHNQPSSHKIYGEAQAILAGDGLQALAFEIISSDDLIDSDTKVKLLNLLSLSAFRMAEGQSIDLSILDSFSNHIGLAYQVQDDVLDVTTSDEILGKRQNSDSVKNKPSYPSILGLDESVKKYESLYREALDEISFLSVDEKPLKDLTVKLMERSF